MAQPAFRGAVTTSGSISSHALFAYGSPLEENQVEMVIDSVNDRDASESQGNE